MQAVQTENIESLLRVEGIYLRRGGRDILRGITLNLSAGQVHALLGLNGSGKSSLAYVIMGCEGYRPDSGRVLFDGQDLEDHSITARARLGITLAWQEPARFEGLPVGEYIGLGLAERRRQAVVDALEAVSLPPELYGHRPADRTLSGGERKRVELAAVYAQRPRLAILDEPDSGIDILSLRDIERLVRRMASEGSAVMLITHRGEMAALADAASILCLGKVVFSGGPSEAQAYYQASCQAHMLALGMQPWDETKPEVRAALAANGQLQANAHGPSRLGEDTSATRNVV